MVSEPGAGGKNRVAASSQRAVADTERQTLGKYELRKKIGSGGMGTVYLAFDTQLKRTVALKVLPKERAANPTLVKRFQSEAQAAAQAQAEPTRR